ncbi:MAG: hypothetical protein QM771_08135 [Nitrospira sp.]
MSIWLAMLILALVNWAHGSRNVPFSEDWLLVPALTGHEPHLGTWLWSQHNEHRVPLPRLMLLVLLTMGQGDFRIGGALNILALGGIALLMMETARYVRGGLSRVADAFFPVAFLHLGHTENMLWTWQITQVLPVILVSVLMLIAVAGRLPRTTAPTLAAGVCTVLLPLCGANGLLYAPMFAFWIGYVGIVVVAACSNEHIAGERWKGWYLVSSSVLTLLLSGLYFVEYHPPQYGAEAPTILAALYATLQFIALSFGPAARTSWLLSIAAAMVCLVPALVIGVKRVVARQDTNLFWAAGLAVCAANLFLSALAIGWGRAQVLSLWGGIWPIRYSLFAVPILCLAYFVYELYGSPRTRQVFQTLLCGGMALLIPANATQGARWHDWYLQGAGAFEQDVQSGEPVSRVGERNRKYSYRWMDPSFDKVRMLRDSGIGPFAKMAEEQPATEQLEATGQHGMSESRVAESQPVARKQFHFVMPEAGHVFLVWGINGWQAAPESFRPAGTLIKDHVLHTPMNQQDGAFVAQLSLPRGTSLDYCFLITKKRDAFDITWPLCEGNYHEEFTADGVREIRSQTSLAVVKQEIRYHAQEAKEVHLVWGVKGWHVAPQSLWPSGTTIIERVMHTPMALREGIFVATLTVPVATPVDYGFQITKRRGIFDLVYPLFDGNYIVRPVQDGQIDMQAKPGLIP